MTGNDGVANAINIVTSSRVTPERKTVPYHIFQKSRGELKMRSAMEYFHKTRGVSRNQLPNIIISIVA